MPSQYGWLVSEVDVPWLGDDITNNTVTNCSDGAQWVWVLMHDCVQDWRGQTSTILGLLSMLVWMIVGIPQMVKNCRNINGMAGVSFFLLAQWFGGDVTNLVGSILTSQLPVQVYVAVYYVAADIALLIQYIYYLCHERRKKRQAVATPTSSQVIVQPILCISGLFMFGSLAYLRNALPSLFAQSKMSRMDNFPIIHHSASRNLLAANVGMRVFVDFVDETGYAIGVISSLLYVGSRLAQIIRNYRLKSTEGLSKIMFFLAVLGNLLYGLAILIRSVEGVFLIRHLPWLVGSLGVIFLDVFILIQFRYYEQRNFDSLSRRPLIVDQIINVEPTYN